jgi:hypothetical protein
MVGSSRIRARTWLIKMASMVISSSPCGVARPRDSINGGGSGNAVLLQSRIIFGRRRGHPAVPNGGLWPRRRGQYAIAGPRAINLGQDRIGRSHGHLFGRPGDRHPKLTLKLTLLTIFASNQVRQNRPKSLILLAGVAGLEPATPGFGDRRSLYSPVPIRHYVKSFARGSMTCGSVSFRLVTSRISVFGSKLGSNKICRPLPSPFG